MEALLIFPHQLFRNHPLLRKGRRVLIIEEYLFFKQYNFHKTKLAFHRASMKAYESFLLQNGFDVAYIPFVDAHADVRELPTFLIQAHIHEVFCCDPVDDWLMKRLRHALATAAIRLTRSDSPSFILGSADIHDYFSGKDRFFQTDFYVKQRKRLHILVDNQLNPEGGKWSFDAENRERFPKGKKAPPMTALLPNQFASESRDYVRKHFADHYGKNDDHLIYPTTFQEADEWLEDFLTHRFRSFGIYEDAIVHRESILHHSVLSPLLNAGLLEPGHVLDKLIDYAGRHRVPINSLEGIVRQILGWREFIRGVYVSRGVKQRTTNFWGFSRKIPPQFWTGTTGIVPIDETIRKVLRHAYCHHIERLMVIGNFMLLCEFDPDEVYRWFMELFIDAYDWVMVPNVYGMSQFADGGLMATKPYISGSNYLVKMSDYGKAEWHLIWDALFWRFMDVHRDFFISNPRLSMLVRSFDKMDKTKQHGYLTTASKFLDTLDQ